MDIFLGTIAPLGFNFAPYTWALCQGQILSISQYSALFALLGTAYGGNGTSNFGLPNLGGRVANCQGQSSGTSNYTMGQTGGNDNVTLNSNNLPAHQHILTFAINANNNAASHVANPTNAFPSKSSKANTNVYHPGPATASVFMNPPTITLGNTGGTSPISVQDPGLVMNYSIALQGIFPTRN
jgi:microcystin-dependent protein